MSRTYKIRSYPNSKSPKTGKEFMNYSLTLPPELAAQVPDGIEFAVTMDEDGIHYRPHRVAPVIPDQPPTWTSDNGVPEEPKPKAEKKANGTGSKRKRPSRAK